jgi:hypothetical protein
MKLRGCIIACLVAGVVAGVNAAPVAAKDGENAQAAIAAIIGAAVAVAAAKHGQTHNANTTWDSGRYGQPFEPERGVTCVPRLEQCFKNGRLSYSWTRRVFG